MSDETRGGCGVGISGIWMCRYKDDPELTGNPRKIILRDKERRGSIELVCEKRDGRRVGDTSKPSLTRRRKYLYNASKSFLPPAR
jgi:hypothetical protein